MDRNSQAYWENQFKKFEMSGLSKEEFCNSNKLDRNLFFRWLKKIRPDLKGHIRKSKKSSSAFIAVKEKSPEQIQIKLASGIELSFSTDTSPRWIANFLKEIEMIHA